MGRQRRPDGGQPLHLIVDPYIKNAQIWRCPSKNTYRGYGCNWNISDWQAAKALPDIIDAANTAYTCDTAQCSATVIGLDPSAWNDLATGQSDWQWAPPSNWTGGATTRYTTNGGNELRRPVGRHNDGLNVGYTDGHVKWLQIGAFVGPMPAGYPYGDPNNSWDNR